MINRLRTALLPALVVAPLGVAHAAETRTYDDVSEAVFACIKATSAAEQGTVYAPAVGNAGTATTSSSLWTVVMSFVFSPDSGNLEYTLEQKSWVVPAGSIWSGIAGAIDGCRSG